MITRKKRLRDGFNKVSGFCGYCQKKMDITKIDSHDAPTIDHIKPKAKGGTNQKSNLICVCFECNQKKADKPLVDFLLKLRHTSK